MAKGCEMCKCLRLAKLEKKAKRLKKLLKEVCDIHGDRLSIVDVIVVEGEIVVFTGDYV